jgi:hypothetical protein
MNKGKNSIKNTGYVIVLLFCCLQSTWAHQYFFGLSDINYNQTTQHIEIIHQLSAHDIENAIAISKNIRFGVDHPQYEQHIRQYVTKRFKILHHGMPVTLKWVGLEFESGQLFIYQESENINDFSHISIQNDILVDVFPQQVNTVNYQLKPFHGTLTFTSQQRSWVISEKN